MANQKAVFLEGDLMRHVIVMSVTSSIGLMAIFAVDLVDMIFLGMLGEAALAAAAGYAGTVLFFTNSINIGLSIAAGALCAQALGKDQAEDAREYATSVSVFAVITGLIIPMIALPNVDIILEILGADGDVKRLAAQYLYIVMPTMPLMGVAMVMMAVLRAYGAAKPSMYALIIGGVVNAVLDPILIFGFDLNLAGAAYATSTSRFVMVSAALYVVIRTYNGLKRPSFGMIKRDAAAVTKIAFPAVMANIATPVGNAIITREMAKFGTDAVAAMAVIGRLIPVAFAVVLALSGAIGPIVGQNRGAGAYDRVREAFYDALKFSLVYVVTVSAILFLLRGQIADLFRLDGEARALVYLFCGPLALSYFFLAATFVANASFNNLGRPSYSTYVNWGKNTLGTWPFAIAGAYIGGASGILIGQAIGAFVFAVIAVILARRVMRDPGDETYAFAGHRTMHQLFTRRPM